MRVILFAALGAATGAAALELVYLLPNDHSIIATAPAYVIPGLVFGIAFGVVLLRLEFLRATGAVAYTTVSTLSHAAASYLAIAIIDPISSVLPISSALETPFGTAAARVFRIYGIADFSVTGFIASVVGGGLLAGATALLIRRLQWPLLIVAGAVLGAFLPLIDLHSSSGVGVFLFYAIWQAGYAATLAAILPPTASAAAASAAVK